MTRRNLLKSLAVAVMLPIAQVFGHEPDVLPGNRKQEILRMLEETLDKAEVKFTTFKSIPLPCYERLT